MIGIHGLLASICMLHVVVTDAQESPKEEDYFVIHRVPAPEGTVLEVGGLAVLTDGNLAVATRRGDVYIIENPTEDRPYFRKFASGLHEPLGLVYHNGAFYCAQRGELTRLYDTDKDGRADVYETVCAWPLSGHYHEYSFGPKVLPNGDFMVTTNIAFGEQEWWRGESRVPWRGWSFRVNTNGDIFPWATGMRSPAGLSVIDGQFFYTENQGDWVGSGGLWLVQEGVFTGHPAGLKWTDDPRSPVRLSMEAFLSKIDERRLLSPDGKYIKPENIINEQYLTLATAKEWFPSISLPVVWLPHGILGISSSEPIRIPENHFGPFAGQLLVGDQGMSMLSRVMLERVNGQLQGAAIAFRSGFRSGVLRLAWAPDGSLFIGETNRGWGSLGNASEGLERLVWNGETPFEINTVKAMPDGFEIAFTQPINRALAEDLASYHIERFTYKYHPVYGSPPVEVEKCEVRGVKVYPDGLTVRLLVDNLVRHFIHSITLDGIREKDNAYHLVHPTAYYTLHQIPHGAGLKMDEVSTKNSAMPRSEIEEAAPPVYEIRKPEPKALVRQPTGVKTKIAPTYADVKGLLQANTCLACHHPEKRQIGPPFLEIAKRKYSNEKIIELIHNPKPENWPDYATEMPPMPHVSRGDALKIAQYINSLIN